MSNPKHPSDTVPSGDRPSSNPRITYTKKHLKPACALEQTSGLGRPIARKRRLPIFADSLGVPSNGDSTRAEVDEQPKASPITSAVSVVVGSSQSNDSSYPQNHSQPHSSVTEHTLKTPRRVNYQNSRPHKYRQLTTTGLALLPSNLVPVPLAPQTDINYPPESSDEEEDDPIDEFTQIFINRVELKENLRPIKPTRKRNSGGKKRTSKENSKKNVIDISEFRLPPNYTPRSRRASAGFGGDAGLLNTSSSTFAHPRFTPKQQTRSRRSKKKSQVIKIGQLELSSTRSPPSLKHATVSGSLDVEPPNQNHDITDHTRKEAQVENHQIEGAPNVDTDDHNEEFGDAWHVDDDVLAQFARVTAPRRPPSNVTSYEDFEGQTDEDMDEEEGSESELDLSDNEYDSENDETPSKSCSPSNAPETKSPSLHDRGAQHISPVSQPSIDEFDDNDIIEELERIEFSTTRQSSSSQLPAEILATQGAYLPFYFYSSCPYEQPGGYTGCDNATVRGAGVVTGPRVLATLNPMSTRINFIAAQHLDSHSDAEWPELRAFGEVVQPARPPCISFLTTPTCKTSPGSTASHQTPPSLEASHPHDRQPSSRDLKTLVRSTNAHFGTVGASRERRRTTVVPVLSSRSPFKSVGSDQHGVP